MLDDGQVEKQDSNQRRSVAAPMEKGKQSHGEDEEAQTLAEDKETDFSRARKENEAYHPIFCLTKVPDEVYCYSTWMHFSHVLSADNSIGMNSRTLRTARTTSSCL